MKKFVFLLTAILLSSFFAFTQNVDYTEPQLKKADVERFLNCYKEIEADFESLDFDYQLGEGDFNSIAKSLNNIEEVNDVVQKHGYADASDFFIKTWAISMSYIALKIEKEGNPEMKKAITEIQNNPNMTAEQKEMAISQLKQVMDSLGTTYTSMTNAEDKAVIEPFVEKLDAVFEE
ncbi:MAG: hypothetical protein JXA77_08785 [Bacteroidales bacterium]|nr:hypothetical protein [Bacteroidales bacterium]MBN2817602.1 hypothetical protein [Bacteroidales bacterium]